MELKFRVLGFRVEGAWVLGLSLTFWGIWLRSFWLFWFRVEVYGATARV